MMIDTTKHTDEDTEEERNSQTELSTDTADVVEGGAIGLVGGAIVGALAGGPIGAVIGAIIGGAASAAGVAAVENVELDSEEPQVMREFDPGFQLGDALPRLDLSPIPSEITAAETYEALPTEPCNHVDEPDEAITSGMSARTANPNEAIDAAVISADDTPTITAPPPAYDGSAIRVRAYYIYENRGRADGAALQDWLQAEREYWARAI